MPILAIDIGGTKTAAALIDDDDLLLEHTTWPSLRDASEALERIVAVCSPWAPRASAAGVSFGGQFDFANQTCVRSMHIPGWDGVDISARLERALHVPTMTDNDANVAALGEYALAAPKDRDPMLYVTVSTGVGAAIIANNQLVRGAHSLAGELGHLPIGHDKACNCGATGCLERAVSGFWIEHDHGIPAAEYLSDQSNFDAWLADLAVGLWSSTVLLDPALIVLGGGMTTQGDRLLEPLRALIDERARASNRTPPRIELGDSSGRTVLIGAAELAKEVSDGPRG